MIRYFVLTVLLFLAISLYAQEDVRKEKRKVIQLTGVVFAPDSSSVVPGVHVYVPSVGRGTTTNPYGFFSMPVLEGDSIVFSAIGFEKQHYIVPVHDQDHSLKVLVTLKEDITFLDEVEIFPYPTEAMFKEAVLSLELPHQMQYDNMNAWLAEGYMRSAYSDMPASANANYQYYMQLQQQALRNKYQTPSNNLLNPFAWAKFIKSLKND